MLSSIFQILCFGVVIAVGIPIALVCLVGMIAATFVALWIMMGMFRQLGEWLTTTMQPYHPPKTYTEEDGKIVEKKRYYADPPVNLQKTPVPPPPLSMDITEMSPAPFEFEK